MDIFAGRGRALKKSTQTLRKRKGKLLKRVRRLQSLKTSGYNMQEVYKTGLQQYSYYGAEVLGLNTEELKTAQAQYLALVGHRRGPHQRHFHSQLQEIRGGGRRWDQPSPTPQWCGKRRRAERSSNSSTSRDSNSSQDL